METAIKAAYQAATDLVTQMRMVSHLRNERLSCVVREPDDISDPKQVRRDDWQRHEERKLEVSQHLSRQSDELLAKLRDLDAQFRVFDELWLRVTPDQLGQWNGKTSHSQKSGYKSAESEAKSDDEIALLNAWRSADNATKSEVLKLLMAIQIEPC